MTILDTAQHLDVSRDIIKDIKKRYLMLRFSRPKLGKLKKPENLNREEPRRLEEALELNQPLAAACYMKEGHL